MRLGVILKPKEKNLTFSRSYPWSEKVEESNTHLLQRTSFFVSMDISN